MEAETPVSIFTTFMSLTTGSARRAKVLEAQNPYDPRHDFYRRLREGALASIVTRNPSHVYAAGRQVHPQRADQYQLCARGLDKWIRKTSYTVEERPRPRRISVSELRIRVNPEIVLRIDGRLHLIKFLTRQDRLLRDAKNAYAFLLNATHGADGIIPGLLDLRRSSLLIPKPPTHIDAIVESEAAAFVAMWRRNAAA